LNPPEPKEKKQRGGKRAGAGRKPKLIDWDAVKRMAQLPLKRADIVNIVGLDDSNFDRRCQSEQGVMLSEFLETNRSHGRAELLGIVDERIKSGDPRWAGLLIFKLKNTAGWADTQEVKQTVTNVVEQKQMSDAELAKSAELALAEYKRKSTEKIEHTQTTH
jgi:hypothetical protein